jgi:hypothetical protein
MSNPLDASGILPCMRVAETETKYIVSAGAGRTDPDQESDSDILDCELSGGEVASDSESDAADDMIIERPPIEYDALVAETLKYVNSIVGI